MKTTRFAIRWFHAALAATFGMACQSMAEGVPRRTSGNRRSWFCALLAWSVMLSTPHFAHAWPSSWSSTSTTSLGYLFIDDTKTQSDISLNWSSQYNQGAQQSFTVTVQPNSITDVEVKCNAVSGILHTEATPYNLGFKDSSVLLSSSSSSSWTKIGSIVSTGLKTITINMYYESFLSGNTTTKGHLRLTSRQNVSTPSAPTGVSASDGTYSDRICVSWDSVSGATSYTVYRSESTTGTKTNVGDTSSTSFDDTSSDLVAETTYHYWVKASNSAGTSGFSSSDTGWKKLASSGNAKYALCVGINTYTLSGCGNLSGCVNDASFFYNNLVSRGGWSASNMTRLTDSVATKSAIRKAIQAYAAAASSGDTFIYQHSSHGGSATDSSGNYTKDVCLCAYDEEYWDYELASDLAGFASGVKVVVIADTCHSGGLFKGQGKTADKGISFDIASRVSALIDAQREKEAKSGTKAATKGISSSEIGWATAAEYDKTSADGGCYDGTAWMDDFWNYNYSSPHGGYGCGGAFMAALTWGWWTGKADSTSSSAGNGSGTMDAHEGFSYAKSVLENIGLNSPVCLNSSVLRNVVLGTNGGFPTSPSISVGDWTGSGNSSTITVNWSGAKNATSYKVYRATTPYARSSSSPIASELTSSSYTDSSSDLSPGTRYYYWVEAVNSSGSAFSGADYGYTGDSVVPLSTALDNTALSFTSGGGAEWWGLTGGASHDGTDAAHSGKIGDSQDSWLQTTVSGPGKLSFWWKVSCEAGTSSYWYDCLEIVVDEVVKKRIEGQQDWTQFSLDISESGTHTVKWNYHKDSSGLSGSDCGWVDQVEWTPLSRCDLAFVVPDGGTCGSWSSPVFLAATPEATSGKVVFDSSEAIYPHVVYGNLGDQAVQADFTIRHELLDDSQQSLAVWNYAQTNDIPSQTTRFWRNYAWPGLQNLSPGRYTYKVELDVGHVIDDADRGNNAATVGFTIVDPPVSVSFITNGGTSCGDSEYTVGSTYGSLPTTTRTGYTFEGWYTSSSFTTRVTASSAVSQSVTTLYAKWTPISYSVSYALGGGPAGAYAPSSATFGTAFRVSAPTLDGKVFAGWTVTSGLNSSTAKWGDSSSPSTAVSGASTVCFSGEDGDVWFLNLRSTSGSVTLTATWEDPPPPVYENFDVGFFWRNTMPRAVYLGADTNEIPDEIHRVSTTAGEDPSAPYLVWCYANFGEDRPLEAIPFNASIFAASGASVHSEGGNIYLPPAGYNLLFSGESNWFGPTIRALGPGNYTLRASLDPEDILGDTNRLNNVALVRFAVTPETELPFAAALGCGNLAFSVEGDAEAPFGQAFDGSPCVQFGPQAHSAYSALCTTVSGSGSLSFEWKASCEAGYDGMLFLVDGETVETVSGISSDWASVTLELGDGSHELMWAYSKDNIDDDGLDAAFLRNVAWTPDTTAISNLRARQRYPWNGLVDISFTLEGEAWAYDFSIAATNAATGEALSTATVYPRGGKPGDELFAEPGEVHLVWDAGTDVPESVIESVALSVTARDRPPDKVQLWEGGPYWATKNVGAEKPEGYGLYFWWGDTVGYRREGGTWVASDGSSRNFTFYDPPTYYSSFQALESAGWITANGVLSPEHDAAHVHLGGSWRMPTKAEFSALNSNCDWMWTTLNGVNGYIVRGRGDYSRASIFFPAAGDGWGTSLDGAGSYGGYWSSTPSDYRAALDDSYFSWDLSFKSDWHGTYSSFGCWRSTGRSVRPVQGFAE